MNHVSEWWLFHCLLVRETIDKCPSDFNVSDKWASSF